MQSLQTLINLARSKLSGQPYHHRLFRLGMQVTLDPTPFILGGTSLKTKQGELNAAVTGIALVKSDGLSFTRLYLDQDNAFLQLWINDQGGVEECRYFTRLDQEIPTDEATWGVWLDEAEGLIGWSEFQTLDATLYQRRWSPGLVRCAPMTFDESIETIKGTFPRSLRAMLYARATGCTPPGPDTEFLLVTAVEAGSEAWVDIHTGIDLNPATLSFT